MYAAQNTTLAQPKVGATRLAAPVINATNNVWQYLKVGKYYCLVVGDIYRDSEVIPLGFYLLGKIGHSIISTLIAAAVWAAIYGKWNTLLSIAALLPILLATANTILKNYSRNFSPIGV